MGFAADARRYRDLLGWSPIPVESDGKRPLVQWQEYQTRHATDGELEAWETAHPGCGLGIVTGAVSGNLVVVDVDNTNPVDFAKADSRVARYIATALGGKLPPYATTPRGGHHYYVRCSKPEDIPQSTARLNGDPVDVRGDRGYVKAPPSRGYAYATSPFDREIPTVTREMLQPFSSKQQKQAKASSAVSGEDKIPTGQRNAALASLAGSMRRRGFSESAIRAALKTENAMRCDPPLGDKEIAGIAKSVSRYAPALPQSGCDFTVTPADLISQTGRTQPTDAEDKKYVREMVMPSLPDAAWPKTGWLAEAYELGVSLTDAPLPFHLFTAATVYGVALGRRVCLPWGVEGLFPNLYTLLIAKSGLRKSTVTKFYGNLLPPEFVLNPPGSREGYLADLAEKPVSVLRVDEFGSFLGSCEREYLRGVVGDITSFYDCPEEIMPARLRRAENSIIIRDCAPSIIGATTADWFAGRAKEDDFAGGFLARFIFVLGPSAHGWKPTPGKAQRDRLRRLRDGLPKMPYHGEAREVEMTPEAEECYGAWLFEHEKIKHPPTLAGMWRRLGPNLLKLALIYQHNEDGCSAGTLSRAHIERASLAIEYVRAGAAHFMRYGIAWDRSSKIEQKVLAMLEEAGKGGLTGRELTRRLHIRLRDFDAAIAALVEWGDVVMADETDARGVRRLRFYHGTAAPDPAL